jgi:uracil-DNA glycosylase
MITNFFKPIPKAKLKRLVQDENEDLNSLLESKKSKCDLNAWHSDLPVDWMEAIGEELKKSYYKNMIQKINQESFKCTIYPAEGERFSFMKCLLKNVKVVIIGQGSEN